MKKYMVLYMGVSENYGIPKSSNLIGFSIIFTIHFGFFSHYFLETSISQQGSLTGFHHEETFPVKCVPKHLSARREISRCTVTLRESNLAIGNGPFEVVFPIENGKNPSSYVSLPEGTGR